ncbi:hypothetical protein LCGC14_0439270 [marine sediment metagenome]|uniref:Uncharacterized protein n=1 Tax=marine sediment metagenome TaxID=412755 RepID=A0A0F9SRS4_9ZZZZ
MKLRTLKDIIRKYSRQMKEHLAQFGENENRDIDTREKASMTMIPIIIEKKLREEAKKWVEAPCPKGDKNCVMCLASDKTLKDFFNLEEDLEQPNIYSPQDEFHKARMDSLKRKKCSRRWGG